MLEWLKCRFALAKVERLYQAGRYAEAVPLAEQTFRLATKTLGERHPETLTSLNNLAALYKAQGRLGRAASAKGCLGCAARSSSPEPGL